MTTPLGLHILARLVETPSTAPDVDRKAKFGKYQNQQASFARSGQLPELVTEHLPEVIRREFALTPPATPDDVDPIPKSAYQAFWLDHVGTEPWDIYSIAEAMADEFDISEGWAFKTARQHLNQLTLQARMRGYRDEGTLVGRRFDWGGPEADHPACQWIRSQVPEGGLPYHELVELMGEAKHRFVDDPPSAPHTVHDWCRHGMVEVP